MPVTFWPKNLSFHNLYVEGVGDRRASNVDDPFTQQKPTNAVAFDGAQAFLIRNSADNSVAVLGDSARRA